MTTEQDLPFATVSVYGYENTPVAWGLNKHGHLFGGENIYTFTIFSDDKESYWLYYTNACMDTFL